MYWIGLQPGDVHLNVSSPGWAKHAWSCVFAPWIAGATICLYNYARFDAAAMLDTLRDAKVTTFCAPPTVWRMLIQQDLAAWRDSLSLRELVGAGEPLNPEVIEAVRRGLGITIRDGFGQTETTLQIGNSPGQELKLGSMGRPMPGFAITLVDPVTERGRRGGRDLRRAASPRPVGLMVGYRGDDERNADAFAGGRYHTGDVATRDADGYITYVGRSDDVFKASDYRISPFELESVLIEHPAVAEAAVVPAPGRGAAGRARRPTSSSSRAASRARSWPARSSRSAASTSRRTSGSGGSSSPTCRRRSAARSAGSSCAARRPSTRAPVRRASTARRTSADWGPEGLPQPLLGAGRNQQDELVRGVHPQVRGRRQERGLPARRRGARPRPATPARRRTGEPAGNRWGPCTRRCCCCRRAAGSSAARPDR